MADLPIYNGSATNASTATQYIGGGSWGASLTNDVWWTTARGYTDMSGLATLVTAPGAGTQWNVSLTYAEAALVSTDNCTTATTVSTGTLCSIANSNLSCSFTVDLTTLNGFVGIAARSCFAIVFTPSGAVASTAKAVALEMRETAGEGISAFASSTTASNNATAYLGMETTTTSTSALGYLQTPVAVNACSGMLVLNASPGTSRSWAVDVLVSTTGKTDAQSCDDLSYTTVSSACSIAGSDRNCRFTLNSAMVVPAKGCLQMRRVPTGSPTFTGAHAWSIECSANTTETATANGAVFAGSTSTDTNATSYAAKIIATSSTNQQTFFRTGATALQTCTGCYVASTTGTGSSTPKFDVALRYSTPSTIQSCTTGSPTYTTTPTLCTQNVGTTKGCCFTDAPVTIPAYSCLGIVATKSGTISTAPVDGNWTVTCTPSASSFSVNVLGTQSTTADRVKLNIDGQPADVGAGAFTIEMWVRGTAANNASATGTTAGDTSAADYAWINGHIFIDRDVNGTVGTGGDWGASFIPTSTDSTVRVIRFGLENSGGTQRTIQGSTHVLDDTWHHVAVTRSGANLAIYVDGVLDFNTTNGPTGDLSYDGLLSDSPANPFLVFGHEKHFGSGVFNFNGFMDEIRVWDIARTQTQIAADMCSKLAGSTTNLKMSLRLDEGTGTALTDTTGLNTGITLNSTAGSGGWSTSVAACLP